MNRKTKIITVAGAAVALTTAACAMPFSWEAYAKYITGDASVEDLDFDSSNIAFGATYYFPTAFNRDGAFRELPFLDRASWVNAEFDIGDLDDSIDNTFDTNAFAARGVWVHPDTGWFVGGGFLTSDADEDADSGVGAGFRGLNSEFNGYTIRGGKYIFQNTTLELVYTRIDVGQDDAFSQSGTDSDATGIAFKHYGPLTDTIGYSFSGSYYLLNFDTADWDDLDEDPFEDDGQVWSVEGAIYPMRELGLGLGYTDADDLMGRPFLGTVNEIYDGLGVFAEWFATDNLSLRVQYTNNEYDVADFDELNRPNEVENDSLAFRAGYRF